MTKQDIFKFKKDGSCFSRRPSQGPSVLELIFLKLFLGKEWFLKGALNNYDTVSLIIPSVY